MRKADFRGLLSVAATSVYGMDHTGDNTSSDVNGGADAPIESGSRSQALLAELADARVARARAEAREAELMVQIDQARTSEASAHDNPRIRSLEASSAADDIGLTMALTAGHISNRLDEYSLVRTPGQLGAWLRRQIARLEPEHQRERKESAWQQRRADISHDHTDGTAHLFSVLSADDGIAIQDMIDQLARDRANQTEGLTAQQACADVIADILLGRITLDGSDTGTTRVRAESAS